ncbi:AsmA family protein [Aestuariirhabdus litorea]|uniref:AsmA family protein n=1 Tax=Aestuariirhabdus litorea TaxID=2528527 RepID=A0A3P3VJ89_9GAMM|nr:AsmA family protein [Aestuariirhabdus litorea]RRJ82424.1 AsmA family protein [Aestuariirhabdus litorea]RWW92587.1 AsmA family protein [Endozoicomonadaceae bacterium GTF-13]
MKALLKAGLIALLLAIVLLVAALVIIPLLVNPNDYKPQLQQLVREQSGMELLIDGEIGLSIFPTLGFTLQQVSLANQGQPLARLEQAQMALKLLPLLGGKVEVQALALDGLDLQLVKTPQGEANWVPKPPSGLGTASTATPDTPDQPAAAQTPAGGSGEIRLSVSEIRIRDISLHYLDQQQGKEYRLEQMSLLTGAIEPGQPFPLELNFNLDSRDPELSLKTRLTAEASLDLARQHYRLQQLVLDSQLSGATTGGKSVPLRLAGNIDAQLGEGRIQLDTLSLGLANLTANADLKVTALQPLRYEGSLQLPAFDLKALMSTLGQPALDTQDPAALKAIALSSQLSGSDQSIELSGLQLGLDGSRFNGRIAIPSFANQALRFSLKGDSLNVDRYLPPAPAKGGKGEASAPATPPPAAAASSEWDDSPLLPVETLSALDLVGELQLGRLVASGVTISDASLKLSARNGLLKLEQLKGGAFDGQFSKTASLDLNKSPISLNATVDMEKVDISEVLKLVNPDKPAARGRANISTRLDARGNSQRKLVNSLNGTTRFSIDDGALLGTNLNQLVCRAVASVRKKTLAEQSWPQETPFRSLGGSLNIRNGVAGNNDLIAAMDNLKLSGDGEINLPAKALDYRLGLTIVGNGADQDEACQINEKYANIAWPVRCNGSFVGDKRLCGIDSQRMGAVVAGIAGQEVQQKINKKLEEKLGSGLKGLFDKLQ